MQVNSTYKLSVIIVNYNVEYFLDQCLDSIKKSTFSHSLEVIIIDNNSVDGSVKMINSKYTDYLLIKNNENTGFSKANNQGINIAKGEYILLLNPDTVVAEDTFQKCIDFMDSHENCGGLGIKMIDGKGNFLPESKRGLPTPMVAFYKIFGFSKLFPKSKRFGQYHLGYLSNEENHRVDVLSGAYMLMRKSVLDEIGNLDEEFFMYGEDIDLSYRITQAGYDNYYFSESSIVHYKGESTKKSSVNYVFVFYNAMVIFAKKHFAKNKATLFSVLINLAIYFRAFLAIITRFLKRIFLPLIDFTYIVGGLFALTHYWEMSNIEFPKELLKYSLPLYAATWLITSFFNGAYDKPIRFFKFLKGVFYGSMIILVAYAILPKSWQFSRLFIFIGAAWVLTYYIVSRIFLHFALNKRYSIKLKDVTNFLIIGDESEFNRISELLTQTNDHIGTVMHAEYKHIENVNLETINEVVFSSKSLDYKAIIRSMEYFGANETNIKISSDKTNYLVGSNSIDTAGDLYILNINTLVNNENKRKKRLFDLLISFGGLLILPFIIGLYSNKKQLRKNLVQIFIGKRTFVGFSEQDIQKDVRLPKIKLGPLSPADSIKNADETVREKLNLLYARDYSMRKDFSLLIKCWKSLDK